MFLHVVKAGDTLQKIAAQYQVSEQRIRTDNGILDENELVVGQVLVILVPKTVYTVQQGDTLNVIAQRFNTTVRRLIQNNPSILLSKPLYPGDVLAIDFTAEKLGEMSVNGYAYTHINEGILRSALPFLTYLTIFGYGFTESGELIPINDEKLIEMARMYGAAPILLLSTVTSEGIFSSTNLNKMLKDEVARETLLDNLISVMQKKGYVGIDIDFEYVERDMKEAYIDFIRYTTQRMHAMGFTVNVDLAPKTSSRQTGLLYESHDYSAIGAISDTVLLMTYEWGYTYGPPMAVAPIDKVQEVLRYGLTEIPAEKIFLGVPNYGYNWKLPYERGVTKAQTIGNLQAVRIAAQYGAEIQFDNTAKSPYFTYQDEQGQEHVVWFEDGRSIYEKLYLIRNHALYGAGYWNVMRPFPQNWALLNAIYDIKIQA